MLGQDIPPKYYLKSQRLGKGIKLWHIEQCDMLEKKEWKGKAEAHADDEGQSRQSLPLEKGLEMEGSKRGDGDS